ncbi:unnamed protein product [Ectocarpus sp. CCAP 1310/34]|nr:unnamed protein product [Ectocarpus sp. CCAP 1310/34]
MSTHSSTMIDMSDVASALERVKKGRADSANSLLSWASQGTSGPTPPYVSPHRRPSTSSSSSSSSSSSASGSGATSPCSSAGCGNSFTSGLCASSRRGTVRWSDECGGELVTQVRTTTDFWEMMVLGDGGCCTCPSSSSNSASSGSSTETVCDGCGELRRRPGGDACCSSSPPGELFRFIAELSRGVEATLVFPGLGGISKKRRPVILYTEDNGESICWIKTGANGSGEPYRIRSKTLLEVKDKSGAGSRAESVARCGGGAHGVEGAFRSECGEQEEDARGGGGTSSGYGTAAAAAATGVRINLKWLPQPTWSKRTVKLVDVQTACPGIFTRGMQQLLSFNSDLQSY